jgi:hypothetical protein
MLATTNIRTFRCECWPEPTFARLAGTSDAGLLGGQAAQQGAEEDVEAGLGAAAVVVVFLPPAEPAHDVADAAVEVGQTGVQPACRC